LRTGWRKRAPICSPSIRANSQRRYARPVDDNRRKNSFKSSPAIDPLIWSWTPVTETSSIVQSRRQVPSIPMIWALWPRSKDTRLEARFPQDMIQSPQSDPQAKTSIPTQNQLTEEPRAASNHVAGWFPGPAKNEAFFERLPATALHNPVRPGRAATAASQPAKISSAGWR
jgi:hypothetical protein